MRSHLYVNSKNKVGFSLKKIFLAFSANSVLIFAMRFLVVRFLVVRFLVVSFLIVSLSALLFPASAQAHDIMCKNFLSQASLNLKKTEDPLESLRPQPQPVVASDKTITVIESAEKIIDVAQGLKWFKKREAEHLKSDLSALKTNKNPKAEQESFKFMLEQWEVFIKDVENKISDFQKLSPQEQKAWRSKMELPTYFATGHFILFLETRNKDFNYSKMSNILEAMSKSEIKEDLFLYLYSFEKQVRKFFSTKEFRRCKA